MLSALLMVSMKTIKYKIGGCHRNTALQPNLTKAPKKSAMFGEGKEGRSTWEGLMIHLLD